MIQDGMDVTMDYTLTVDGAVVDSSEGKEAFRYRHGSQQIIPGLEKALAGLKVGDAKEVTVSPEDGYGQYEADRVIEVSKDQMPSDIGLEIGMVLGGVDAEGRPIRGTIKEIKEKAVVMDMNHPLAGKTLHFKVKITQIKPAA